MTVFKFPGIPDMLTCSILPYFILILRICYIVGTFPRSLLILRLMIPLLLHTTVLRATTVTFITLPLHLLMHLFSDAFTLAL